MEWKEFTQYIIDSVLSDTVNIMMINNNSETRPAMTEVDILDQSYAKRNKKYQ